MRGGARTLKQIYRGAAERRGRHYMREQIGHRIELEVQVEWKNVWAVLF